MRKSFVSASAARAACAVLGLVLLSSVITGCTVLAIADAAASAAVGVVSTGVKVGSAVVGTAVDLAIPDKKEDKK
jgi:hypothetical protein